MESALFCILFGKNMHSKIYYFFLLTVIFVGCTTQKVENPFEVAKNYCTCVEEEIKKSKDSVINIYDCEKRVFPESRLMKIYMSFDNYNKYNGSTLDSARKFSVEVGNIMDTLCINKIDPRRIKKIPHIPM